MLASIVTHVIVAKCVKLPFYSGLAAAAQLGLPAAVVSLGLANHMLDSGQAAAIIVAALLSLVSTTVGMNFMTKKAAEEKLLEPKPGATEQTGTATAAGTNAPSDKK